MSCTSPLKLHRLNTDSVFLPVTPLDIYLIFVSFFYLCEGRLYTFLCTVIVVRISFTNFSRLPNNFSLHVFENESVAHLRVLVDVEIEEYWLHFSQGCLDFILLVECPVASHPILVELQVSIELIVHGQDDLLFLAQQEMHLVELGKYI